MQECVDFKRFHAVEAIQDQGTRQSISLVSYLTQKLWRMVQKLMIVIRTTTYEALEVNNTLSYNIKSSLVLEGMTFKVPS